MCVSHSSFDQAIRLPASQTPFFSALNKTLLDREVAKRCVAVAEEFWHSRRRTFTGLADVDRVLQVFVNGALEKWDGAPFHHRTLEKEESTTVQELGAVGRAFGLVPEEENDSLKALYQCGRGMVRLKNEGKTLSPGSTQAACAMLGLTMSAADAWKPPFLPGILFMAHIRLLKDALAEPKHNNPATTVTCNQGSVTFKFTSAIDGLREWESGTGNTSALLQATRRLHVDRTGAEYLTNTAAQTIAQLLQPGGFEANIDVRVAKKELAITWK
jgi:hypothetical protein